MGGDNGKGRKRKSSKEVNESASAEKKVAKDCSVDKAKQQSELFKTKTGKSALVLFETIYRTLLAKKDHKLLLQVTDIVENYTGKDIQQLLKIIELLLAPYPALFTIVKDFVNKDHSDDDDNDQSGAPQLPCRAPQAVN